MELEKKQPQVFGHLEKWTEQRSGLKETDLWDNKNETVLAGSGRYQEGRTGLSRNPKQKQMNTEEVDYCVHIKHMC